MLTQERAQETFASLAFVVVDEWHELMGNKRGVQTELALAQSVASDDAATPDASGGFGYRSCAQASIRIMAS